MDVWKELWATWGYAEIYTKQVSRVRWAAVQEVGSVSDFANDMHGSFPVMMGVCRKRISPARFGKFIGLFVDLFVQSLDDAIMKCPIMTEVGAAQLILDIRHIQDSMKTTCPEQTDIIAAGFEPVFRLLRVLMMYQETLEHTYKTLFPDGTDERFESILKLRGLKRKVCNEEVH